MHLLQQRLLRARVLLPLVAAMLAGGALWYWLPPVPRATVAEKHSFGEPLYFSPDGRCFVSASDVYSPEHAFHRLTVWDVLSGEQVAVLEERTNPSWGFDQLYSLAFSPDGKKVAALWRSRRIQVWEAETGKLIAEYDRAEWRSWLPQIRGQVWFSHQGKLLTYSSEIFSGKIWDFAPGQQVVTLFDELSPNFSRGYIVFPGFFKADDKDTTRVWNLVTGELTTFSAGETGPFALTPDGRVLFAWKNTSGKPGDCGLWHAGAKEHGRVPVLEEVVWGWPALSPDGTALAVTVLARWSKQPSFLTWLGDTIPVLAPLASNHDSVCVLALPHGQWLGTFRDATQASFSPDGSTLAVIGRDGAIQLYDFPLPRPWLHIIGWAVGVGFALWLVLHAPALLRAISAFVVGRLRGA